MRLRFLDIRLRSRLRRLARLTLLALLGLGVLRSRLTLIVLRVILGLLVLHLIRLTRFVSSFDRRAIRLILSSVVAIRRLILVPRLILMGIAWVKRLAVARVCRHLIARVARSGILGLVLLRIPPAGHSAFLQRFWRPDARPAERSSYRPAHL